VEGDYKECSLDTYLLYGSTYLLYQIQEERGTLMRIITVTVNYPEYSHLWKVFAVNGKQTKPRIRWKKEANKALLREHISLSEATSYIVTSDNVTWMTPTAMCKKPKYRF
jgi:hypothetical protein